MVVDVDGTAVVSGSSHFFPFHALDHIEGDDRYPSWFWAISCLKVWCRRYNNR